MKINLFLKSIALSLIVLTTSCSKTKDDELSGGITGKWVIAKKITYSKFNHLQLRVDWHDHECSTKDDYYEIKGDGTGAEYRYNSNCGAPTKKHTLKIKQVDSTYLIESSNGENYTVETLDANYFTIRHNNSDDTYFTITLYREGTPM